MQLSQGIDFIKIVDMNLYMPLVIGLSLFDLQINGPVKIDGFEVVPENDEIALMKAVSNQPVSVAIDASGSDMQFYSEVTYSVPHISTSLISLILTLYNILLL